MHKTISIILKNSKISIVTLGILLGCVSLLAHADSSTVDNSGLKQGSLLKVNAAGLKGEWVGKAAPDFRLKDQNDQWHELKDYKGKWLVVYFYPLDNSPGCTEEARQFRDLYPTYEKRNIVVLGVSLNDVASHKSFADKLGLPFPLLADTNHDLAKTFNVLGGFGFLPYAKRETFLIDPQGIIVYQYTSVNTESHAAQVLKDVDALSQGH
jgi:peroxiredoxin Q/BCP